MPVVIIPDPTLELDATVRTLGSHKFRYCFLRIRIEIGVAFSRLSETGQQRPSVSVEVAGLGSAGQDGGGRVALGVTLEAIGPLLRCLSVELSARGGAAGTAWPTSVT